MVEWRQPLARVGIAAIQSYLCARARSREIPAATLRNCDLFAGSKLSDSNLAESYAHHLVMEPHNDAHRDWTKHGPVFVFRHHDHP